MGFVSDNLGLLSDIANVIALEFGPNCEVVLHDLTLPYNKTIVAIWNGHVTGRKIGDGGTNAGLEILKNNSNPQDQCYINTLPNGKTLRSISKYFRDEYGKVNGSLCINLDITNLVGCAASIQALIGNEGNTLNNQPEFFYGSLDDILNQMMNEELRSIGKNIHDLSKDDKVRFVQDLDKKGFFLIKKSASLLANYLGMSRFSIYNYLNECDFPKN